MPKLICQLTCACMIFLTMIPAIAQQAQGEDTVQLTQKINYNMLPLNNAIKSTALQGLQESPAWLDAKLARYQARAYSSDTTGVFTEADVTSTTSTDGLKKTCVQEVGSNTLASTLGSGRYGPKNEAQVVVLKGDLVNICR
jgi:hypothetical protein